MANYTTLATKFTRAELMLGCIRARPDVRRGDEITPAAILSPSA